MPLFDGISKKITATAQNVVRSTKEFADTARLNSMINDEQRKISTLHEQIGKLYYETEEHSDETEMGKLCISITAAMERIGELQSEINKIKGIKPCQTGTSQISSTCACLAKVGLKVFQEFRRTGAQRRQVGATRSDVL